MPGLPVYKEANWTLLLKAAVEAHVALQPTLLQAIIDCADANRLLLQWLETRAVKLSETDSVSRLVLDVWPRSPLLSLYMRRLPGKPAVYVLPEVCNASIRLRFAEAVFTQETIGVEEYNVKMYKPIELPVPKVGTIVVADVLQTMAVSPITVLRNLTQYADQDTWLYLSAPADSKLGRVYKHVTGVAELPVANELPHDEDEVIWNYSKDEIASVLVAAGWRPVRFGYTMSGQTQYLNVAAIRMIS